MQCQVCGGEYKCISTQHLRGPSCGRDDGSKVTVEEYYAQFGGVLWRGKVWPEGWTRDASAAELTAAVRRGATKEKSAVLKTLDKLSLEAIDGELQTLEAVIAEHVATRKRLKGLRAIIAGETETAVRTGVVPDEAYQFGNGGDIREAIVGYLDHIGSASAVSIARGLGISVEVVDLHCESLVAGRRLQFGKGVFSVKR